MSKLQLGRADYYYVGSFDDEILRMQQSASLSMESINETFIQAVLFGGPLLVNDGYLMHYEAGRKALTDRNASPLLDLIDEGYVCLFSRNGGNLSKMPEQMSHIDSYAALLKSKEWTRLKYQLEELERRLKNFPNALKPWPNRNFGPGFVRLVNHALSAYDNSPMLGSPLMPDQLDRLLYAFNDEMKSNPNGAARTIWREHYERPDLAISANGKSILHWLGIEAYHYNLAMSAADEESSDCVPGLITRHSYLFDELTDHSKSEPDEGCAPSEIPTPSLSRMVSRSVLGTGKFLSEVVKNGTDLNNAKLDYLLAVQNALRDKQALGEAGEAAKAYAQTINERGMMELENEITKRWNRRLEYVTVLAQGTATIGLSHYHINPDITSNFVAPIIGLLVKDGLDRVRQSLPDYHVNLVVDLFDNLPEYQEDIVEIDASLQGAQWFGLLKIKPAAAREHINSLPTFTQ